MIKVVIDYEKINRYIHKVKWFFLKRLIIKRAYKGYVWFNEMEESKYKSFEEFENFDTWIIGTNFRIYCKKYLNYSTDWFFSNKITLRQILNLKP